MVGPSQDGSHRMITVLARPDRDGVFEPGDEYLAIPDGAGLRRVADQRHHGVHAVVGHDQLELELREEADRVLAAPVRLGMTPLATAAADLGHDHADDPGLGQRLLALVELDRLDDPFDLLPHALRDPPSRPPTPLISPPPTRNTPT